MVVVDRDSQRAWVCRRGRAQRGQLRHGPRTRLQFNQLHYRILKRTLCGFASLYTKFVVTNIYVISSRGQLKGDGPPDWGLGEGLDSSP
jgi:hypothetical protein